MKPDASGEYPYNPHEGFQPDQLAYARHLRQSVRPDPDCGRTDRCPHTPPCPNVEICIEEIAWYLAHWREIETEDVA